MWESQGPYTTGAYSPGKNVPDFKTYYSLFDRTHWQRQSDGYLFAPVSKYLQAKKQILDLWPIKMLALKKSNMLFCFKCWFLRKVHFRSQFLTCFAHNWHSDAVSEGPIQHWYDQHGTLLDIRFLVFLSGVTERAETFTHWVNLAAHSRCVCCVQKRLAGKWFAYSCRLFALCSLVPCV